MNQRPQAKPAPAPAISTPVEARKFAEELMNVMSALLGIIERETELVRAGNVREAMQLEEQKSELSGRYMVAVESLKNAQKYLTLVSPELLTTLRRHHDTFRAMLQINLTVLATRCPKASCAASTPKSSVAIFRAPTPPPASAPSPARGTSSRSRSVARCDRSGACKKQEQF